MRILSMALIGALLAASLMGCESKRGSGTAIGAGAGAAVGAVIDKGGVGGVLLGALIGGLAGYVVGDYMERQDEERLHSTLESQPTGSTSTWRNPDTGNSFAATPTDTRETDDGVYRDVTIKVDSDNDGQYEETTRATAYRQPDGTWTFVE
jgi:surface antigen